MSSGDIAQLGLSIDSSQVTQASAALDDLTTSATNAASGVGAFQDAADFVSETLGSVGAVAETASTGFTTAAAGVDAFTAASAPARDAMLQFEAALKSAVADQNVLATAQRNGTTLQNENTVSILGQREALRGIAADLALFGGSLGQTAGLAATLYLGNERLFTSWDSLASGLTALMTPTNLVIGGLAALTIAGYSVITSITEQEQAYGQLSDRADTTLATLHSLSDAASFKGVDSTDFLKQMTQFSTLSYQANQNIGGLATLFRANGDASGTMQANLLQVADLVQNAASEAEKYQIVQEAGLPATQQWVNFLSQGSAGIRAAELSATAWGNTADQSLVNKAVEFENKWATAWTNFKSGADNAMVGFLADLDSISNSSVYKFMSAALTFGSFAMGGGMAGRTNTPTSSQHVSNDFSTLANTNYSNASLQQGLNNAAHPGAAKSTVDPNALKQQLQTQQELIGVLGPLASIDQTVQEKENAINLARLNGVNITKAQEQAILAYTQAQALGITQINSQTDALDVQIDSFGMASGQAAAYAAVQTKIDEAIRTGNPLTQQQIALLQQNAKALGDSTEQLDEMNTASSAISSGFKGFESDLENNKSAWVSLKDAAMDALNSVADKLADMAAKDLVAAAFGGSTTSNNSGLFGSLFGSLFTPSSGASSATTASVATGMHSGGIVASEATFTRSVDPSVFNGARRFHTGGLVGADEVPIIAKAGEGVFTPQQMKNLAPVGAQQSPQITITQHNDFSNADPGSEARIRFGAATDQKSGRVGLDVAWMKLQRNAPGATRPK